MKGSDRRRKVRIDTVAPIARAASDTNAVEVEVSYTLGGRSIFSGGSYPRGYELSVIPVTVGDVFVSMKLSIGGKNPGGRVFLKPASRFSAKDLDALATRYLPEAEALTRALEAGEETFATRMRELARMAEAA